MDRDTYGRMVDQILKELEADFDEAAKQEVQLFTEYLEADTPMVLKPREFMYTAGIHSFLGMEYMAEYTAFVAWLGYRQKERDLELERMIDG